MKKTLLFVCLLAAMPVFTGCDLSKNHLKMDRSGDMEFQDYRDALAPRLPEPTEQTSANDASGIPSLQSYVATPSENLRPMPLVSIAVNQTVPLRDVLYELASQADYDIEVDPRIKGSIIFTARDRPFDLVIKRIAEISGLRYKFDDDTLRVELDTPYQTSYKIDYLSYIRSNAGSIQNNISVVSGDGADAGSRFTVNTTSEADFWGELESTLTHLVGSSVHNLRSQRDPRISSVDANPVAPVEGLAVDGAEDAGIQVQAPQTTLSVGSLPTDLDDEDSNRRATSGGADPNASTFALNRQAGIVNVYATERQHEQVRDYLKLLKQAVTSQVLIEAKVLEVTLRDEFSAGINWQLLDVPGGEFSLDFINTAAGPIKPPFLDSPTPVGSNGIALGYFGNDIAALAEAVSRFGTVKALASPRLTVMNNQSAVLNVATNHVYFTLDVETTPATDGAQPIVSIDSEVNSVPEGVLINVQPSINLAEKTISMAVRPTITRIVGSATDPAAEAQGVISEVPILSVQEMDSVLKMNNGQAIVMGGLMEDRGRSLQSGVPVLSEVPLLGGLFRTQSDYVEKTELVIFIRATIVSGDNTIHQTDRDLYKTFSGDRRPLGI